MNKNATDTSRQNSNLQQNGDFNELRQRNQMLYELNGNKFDELIENFPKSNIMIVFTFDETFIELLSPLFKQIMTKYVN